jgi:uncharacterized protein DUF3568
MRAIRYVALIVLIAVANGGCVALGLAAAATGLGVGAGAATGYTLDGIAYRTFNASLDETHGAALKSLHRMDMKLESDNKIQSDDAAKPEKREMIALAGDRKVYVDLEKLTSRTTRIRVTAKQGWFWRDRSTAGEIIAQTADALDESPALSQKGR